MLGALFGPVAVGLYRLADRFVSTVLSGAVSSIQMVALPEFSRFQHEPDKLRKSVLTCIRLSATCTLPAFVGLAAVSTPLMQTIGASWLPASHVLPILCMSGMCLTFASFTAPLLQAVSRAHHSALLEWVRTAVGVGSVILAGLLVKHSAIQTQIVTVAVARFAVALIVVGPLFVLVMLKSCGTTLRELGRVIGPAAGSALAVGVSILIVRAFGTWSGIPVVLLGTETMVGAGTGLVVLLTLDLQLRSSLISAAYRVQRYGSVIAWFER